MPPYPRYRALRVCQVQPDIDVLACERLHAAVVVLGPVNAVDTDGVGAQRLHQGSISETDLSVGEGIPAVAWVISGASTRLIGDTHDLEGVARLGVDKLVALYLEGLDSGCQRGCAERHES